MELSKPVGIELEEREIAKNLAMGGGDGQVRTAIKSNTHNQYGSAMPYCTLSTTKRHHPPSPPLATTTTQPIVTIYNRHHHQPEMAVYVKAVGGNAALSGKFG